MWNEWNRWWSGRGAPGERPPEELVGPTADLKNGPTAGSEPDTVESKSAPDTFPDAIGTKSENADNSIAETVPSAEPTPEPPGPPDRGDETAPEFVDSPQSPAWDDLGADADEPTEFATDEFNSSSAHLDPVAELLQHGLGLPTGNSHARRGRRLARPEEVTTPAYNPKQRLMILDCWQRSGLPAQDFATLVGVSKHTLYAWRQRFTQQGPAGLLEQPRGAGEGSRLPELTKRTILLLKQAHPDWGCERISQMLLRGPALPASPPAVTRVLHEAGYELHETPTRPHPHKVRFFERARPNQLWPSARTAGSAAWCRRTDFSGRRPRSCTPSKIGWPPTRWSWLSVNASWLAIRPWPERPNARWGWRRRPAQPRRRPSRRSSHRAQPNGGGASPACEHSAPLCCCKAAIHLAKISRSRYKESSGVPLHRGRPAVGPDRRRWRRSAPRRRAITEGLSMPAGRKPLSIADQIDRLAGSPVAKTRLRAILANLAGQINVADACAELGIEESWFFDLKHESLERWVKTMEPGSPGRPPSAEKASDQHQIAELQAKVERLELELKADQLRAELARQRLSRPKPQVSQAPKKANR